MDTITEPTVEPHKPRKAKRRKPQAKPKVAKTVTEPGDELAGLSAKECPFDCRAERCVITASHFCAHPAKGGLQAAFQNSPEVLDRYNRARKILAHAKIDA